MYNKIGYMYVYTSAKILFKNFDRNITSIEKAGSNFTIGAHHHSKYQVLIIHPIFSFYVNLHHMLICYSIPHKTLNLKNKVTMNYAKSRFSNITCNSQSDKMQYLMDRSQLSLPKRTNSSQHTCLI